MRLCRFEHNGRIKVGAYTDHGPVELPALARSAGRLVLAEQLSLPLDELTVFFPPDGVLSSELKSLSESLAAASSESAARELWGTGFRRNEEVRYLPPIARPSKILLLAGNYTEHILEQGDLAAERANTFPYVFTKPPSTTLVGSNASVAIPACSPSKIDYELELAVVIGRKGRNISAEQALDYVAGYTVINDLSDRGFKPNPGRQERPRDKFFDWLHGKWHDGFCPCGPAILLADRSIDPQKFKMRLTVDGEIRQDAHTGMMVFSVAEVIEFISNLMTLEPGDIISTGTPSGVGNADGRYLKAGHRIEATIDGIGTLVTHMRSADSL